MTDTVTPATSRATFAIGDEQTARRVTDLLTESLEDGEAAVAAFERSDGRWDITVHFARVYGTKSTLHVDYVMRTVTLDAQTKLPSAIGRLVPAFDQGLQYLREGGKNFSRFLKSDFHYFSGLNRLFGMFYDSIVNDVDPPIPYRDILRIAAMMDEIFRQVPQDGSGRRA